MSRNMLVHDFKWRKEKFSSDEEFIEIYYENRGKAYKLEVGVKYTKKLQALHSDLSFLLERMKIKKCKKLVCNLYNKKN